MDSRHSATNRVASEFDSLTGCHFNMNVCFWCKRPKDDTDGVPEYYDYDFCKLCQEKVDKGIVVVQTTETSNGNPPIKSDLYPTGKWVVVTEDRIREVLSGWVGLDDVLKSGHMFMNEDTWKSFKLPN